MRLGDGSKPPNVNRWTRVPRLPAAEAEARVAVATRKRKKARNTASGKADRHECSATQRRSPQPEPGPRPEPEAPRPLPDARNPRGSGQTGLAGNPPGIPADQAPDPSGDRSVQSPWARS